MRSLFDRSLASVDSRAMSDGGTAAGASKRRVAVRLPWGEMPQWLRRCVACDAPAPDDQIRIGATWTPGEDRDGWDFPLFRHKTIEVRAPTCTACAGALRTRRRRGRVVARIALVAALGLTLALVWRGIMYRDGGLLWPTGIAWAVVLLLAWVRDVPFPVELSERGEHQVQYEFRNVAYAQDFARINHAKVLERHGCGWEDASPLRSASADGAQAGSRKVGEEDVAWQEPRKDDETT
jgi:hypothetical protein